MRVILIRHGVTYENIKKISMGQGVDGSLNEEGIEQARKLAWRLKEENIDVAYVSDLKRVVRTAQEILNFHSSAKMILTPELRERNLGIYEGGPNTVWKEAMKESPLPFHVFQPFGGESYAELQNRVGMFFDSLLERHQDNTILLVSHTGVLTLLLLKILKLPIVRENYETYKPGNTAVTICEFFDKESPSVHTLNNTDHLN